MKPSVLEMKRLLPAEVRRVFAAWSSPDLLARWFVCAPDWTARNRKGVGMKTGDDTLSVVRAYYDGWTTKHFGSAIRLLAKDLKVEVPVNEYPTTESFAEALSGFGSLVKRVELLAEFANGDEAMLLNDMDVDRIGAMRVAEHFTVKQGRITKIRQIHDTTAVRAAGFIRG